MPLSAIGIAAVTIVNNLSLPPIVTHNWQPNWKLFISESPTLCEGTASMGDEIPDGLS